MLIRDIIYISLLFFNFVIAQSVAEFSATPLSGNKPLQVSFTDLSIPGTGSIVFWQWNFRDGNLSNEQNPSHTFENAGIYTVELTVRDSGGDVDSEIKTNYVAVDGPFADFTADPRGGVRNLTVNFTNTSQNFGSGSLTTYQWNFGDGSSSMQQNPSHTYSTAGYYEVTLTVTNSLFQSDSEIKTDYITVIEPEFSGTPRSGVPPLIVSFTDTTFPDSGPIGSYLWNFGDGSTSTLQNPDHTYVSEGNYTVTLTITDTLSQSLIETKTNYISVVDGAVIARSIPSDTFPSPGKIVQVEIEIDMTDRPFADEVSSFTASLNWDPTVLTYTNNSGVLAGFLGAVNDADAGNGNLLFNGISTSGVGGIFTVMIVDFTVVGKENDFTLLDLDFSNMISAITSSDLIPFLTIDEGSITIVERPTANFSADVLQDYDPMTVNFTDLSVQGTGNITSWNWDFGDGNSSNETNPVHIYNISDTFTVTLDIRDSYGERDTLIIGNYITALPSFLQQINAEWNLIGAAVEPRDNAVEIMYPNSISNTLFSFDGVYNLQSNLEFGTGYWLRFSAAEQVKIPGPPSYTVTDTLQLGWNLLSGVSENVPLTNVVDLDGVIIPNTWFGFNGMYYQTDSIRAGQGYWVRATDVGIIGIYSSAEKDQLISKNQKNIFANYNLSEVPTLIVKDNKGNEQKIYFSIPIENENDKLQFSLPPMPPKGAFDVRFINDYYVTNNSAEAVHIQASAFPLILNGENLNKLNFEFQDSQGSESFFINEEKELTITNLNNNEYLISIVEEKIKNNIPSQYFINQNYPNPFNPITTISYGLPSHSKVKILIYDVLGRQIKSFVNKTQDAGYYNVKWNGKNDFNQNAASGIYYYVLSTGEFQRVNKMILLR